MRTKWVRITIQDVHIYRVEIVGADGTGVIAGIGFSYFGDDKSRISPVLHQVCFNAVTV